MKKLIYIKFFKDFVVFFIFSLVLFGLIVWILQAVNYFDLVTEDGHGLKIYLLFTIYNMPKILHRVLPFVYFISFFYLLIIYETRNEFNIIWINGVNKLKFANILIFSSLVLMIIQILIGTFISPKFQYKGRLLLKNSNIDFFSSLLKEEKFINVVKGLTIFINKKVDNNSFIDIYLDDSTQENTKIIYAKKGFLLKNDKQKILKLYKGQIINKKENGKINTFTFNQIDFSLNKFTTNTIVKPKIQEMSTFSLMGCFYPNFAFFKEDKILCEKKTLNEIKKELIKRIYKPIYIPLLTIITCFLIVTSRLKTNYNLIRTVVIIMGFLLIILSEATLRYSATSSFNFYLFFIIPIGIFLIAYISFFKLVNNV